MSDNHSTIRIALLGLSLELYRQAIPETIAQYEASHRLLASTLETMGEVVCDRLCYSREEVEALVLRAEAGQADVLVVSLASYHPSLNSLPTLVRTPLPLLVWNTQCLLEVGPDFTMEQLIANHGMHGVQDLCNCLRRGGRTYGLVSGHLEDAAHLADLRGWLRAASAVSFGRRLKVGLLGRPFQGMGDFGVDETRMVVEWGPQVERLTIADLVEAHEAVDEEALGAEMAEDRARFDFPPGITDEDHRRSARLSLAVRRLAEARRLHALTQHFGIYGEDPRLETCPFLGFNHLMASGYGYAGEGNVTIAALDAVLTHVFGRSNFCEMFTADYRNDQVLFYHMGEGNYAMARRGSRPLLKKVPYTFGKGRPYLVPIFQYEPGPSTFVNLTSDRNGRFYLICFEAELTDYTRLDALDAPHFKIQVKGRLGDFLDAYGFHGGTHHLTRVEGHQTKQIARLAHMLGMELKRA